MEPSPSMFEAIMYPTALYFPPMTSAESRETQAFWEESAMNPKTRIDSLDPVPQPRWRIDGNDAGGLRFFAVPLFAAGRPPLSIDVYIPDLTNRTEVWACHLNPRGTMFPQLMDNVRRPLLNFILRILEHWSDAVPDLEEQYFELPFGSYIVLDISSPNVRRACAHMNPSYDVEQQWMPGRDLQNMWQIGDDVWPQCINHNMLIFLCRLHETIHLVKIQGRSSRLFVFKSLSQDVKYMYHELQVLLRMRGHPNIISRPRYLVEKLCRFGGKTGICGFIMDYHSGGTLKDALQDRGRHIDLRTRLQWTHQITSAMIHIINSPAGFYSDFQLDNFVMSQSEQGMMPILVDFEQRGAWYSWSPPEVYLIEYLEYMTFLNLHVDAQKKYRHMLETNLPHWQPRIPDGPYKLKVHGYSAAWIALCATEREAAMVFMMGKLIWCLFEGVGSVNSGITVETFGEVENEVAFPSFRHTPHFLRRLIKECTAGAPEWKGRYPALVRRGAKVYPRTWKSKVEPTPQDVQHAAVSRWKEDLDLAEQFLKGKGRNGNSGVAEDIMRQASRRPKLETILNTIGEFLEDTSLCDHAAAAGGTSTELQ